MQVTHLAISFLLHFLSISVEALHTPHHVHRRFSVDAVLRPNFTSSANSTTNSTSEGIPYWLEQIKHQGVAPFNTNSSYQVFRNVKDFGAKGMLHVASEHNQGTVPDIGTLQVMVHQMTPQLSIWPLVLAGDAPPANANILPRHPQSFISLQAPTRSLLLSSTTI